MRKRLVTGSALLAIGLFLITYSVLAPLAHWPLPIENLLAVGMGLLLIIVAVFLMATEIFESMLARGQTALVDGLQAG